MPADVRATVLRVSAGVIVGCGSLLRLYAYLRQPSLWTDEVAVVRNVITRPLWDLVSRPLDYGQVAPAGYLALLKLLGPSEWLLRLPSLVASIAALLLFLRMAQRITGEYAALASTAAVAFSPVVLVEAARVKPYSSDFALSLLVLLLALGVWERRIGFARAAAAGAAVFWFSQHAVLTGAACGAVIAARAPAVAAVWAVSAGLAATVSLHQTTPALLDYMHHFWASGFMPRRDALPWLWSQLQAVFTQWNARPWPVGSIVTIAYTIAALAGLVLLASKKGERTYRPERALLPLASIAVLLIASALRWYPFAPFSQRLILFESALLFMSAATAVERLTAKAAPLALLVFVAPTLWAVVHFPPPYKRELTSEMLAEIRARREPGDVVYTTSGLALSVLYYAPQHGFRPGEVIAGRCSPDPRNTLRELDRLRGHRVWVLSDNARDLNKLVDLYLRLAGRRLQSIAIDGPGTWETALHLPGRQPGRPLCALYDLRNPDPAWDAEHFQIPRELVFYDAPWWCFGVFDVRE